jgi:hypothetical protein
VPWAAPLLAGSLPERQVQGPAELSTPINETDKGNGSRTPPLLSNGPCCCGPARLGADSHRFALHSCPGCLPMPRLKWSCKRATPNRCITPARRRFSYDLTWVAKRRPNHVQRCLGSTTSGATEDGIGSGSAHCRGWGGGGSALARCWLGPVGVNLSRAQVANKRPKVDSPGASAGRKLLPNGFNRIFGRMWARSLPPEVAKSGPTIRLSWFGKLSATESNFGCLFLTWILDRWTQG